MREYYHISLKSKNAKTGEIPVVTSSSSTCPNSCPFKHHGCYAKGGPLRIHWANVDSGKYGFEFSELIEALRKLPRCKQE